MVESIEVRPSRDFVDIGDARLEVALGDITGEGGDAIVNAANTSLLGGGGVDGAIHRAAGPKLLGECRRIGGCPTGEARITRGYSLRVKYVIHTVGPVYSGKKRDAELLASCYERSLALAVKFHIKRISFPAISTGAYGYPVQDAARVAIFTVARFLKENGKPSHVRLVLHTKESFEVHRESMHELLG